MSLMSREDRPLQCDNCGEYYHSIKDLEHKNLHVQPTQHVPKTYPNTLKKIGLSKVLGFDETTDSSDIAVRSILPDEVPQPERDRKDMTVPTGYGGPNRTEFNLRRGTHTQDFLDLNSNVAATDLRKDNLQTLNIEKVVDLKQVKAVIPNKQIRKYQNSHFVARETVDAGRQDKKVSAARPGSPNSVPVSSPEPMYVIKEDPRTSSFLPQKNPTVTVSLSISKPKAGAFVPIDTKSNEVGSSGLAKHAEHVGQIPFDQEKYKDEGLKRQERAKVDSKLKEQDSDRHVPLHHNECPSCHGFYCRTCQSTIPPKYRPFWDEDEKPELVEYYKKIQEEGERRNCKECSMKEH